MLIKSLEPKVTEGFNAHLSSSVFMHSTNLAHPLHSHYYCTSKLHSAIYMHFTDLPLSLNSHYCAFEFFSPLFIHYTDLAIIVSSYRCSSKLHFAFLCIGQTWLSFSTVIIGDPSSILLFYAFQKPGSISQQSMLHI